MKIAMISEHASPLAHLGGVDAGGQNVHVAELSAALARRGHSVVVYTRRDDSELPERVETCEGYAVVHVPEGPARTLPKDELLEHRTEFSGFLSRRWQSERPDVAHAHFWISGLASLEASRAVDVPTVQTFHTLGVVKRRHQGVGDTNSDRRIRIEAKLAREAKWVSATSTDEVFELARMGRSRAHTSVVPCGVDVRRFRPDGPVAPRTARRRIVTVGRLVPRKGFETLIHAMTRIPRTELLIVGGPDRAALLGDPYAQALRQLAERLGVADRVCLIGAVGHPDIPAVLRSADVVCCTPWYEPFGIVPLEAMACGIPVVAAAVGGIRDTVVDDVTGKLVPPNDAERVADAVIAVLRDASLRVALGSAGRERARVRYTWDRVAADTEHICSRLVPARRQVVVLDSQFG